MQASYVLSLFMMLVAMCGVQSAITQVGKDLHQQGNSLTNEHNAYLQGDLTAAEQRINRRRIYRRMGYPRFGNFW